MAITIDWINKIVLSTASILDIVIFKDTIRDFEDDVVGMIHPAIITYKKVDLGSGAFFHAVDAINGYTLKFPDAGEYSIVGNLNISIVPVAGVYVERKTSAAFSTTAVGGSGPSAGDIAAAVRAEITAELTQLTKISKIHGIGVPLVVTPTSRTAGSVSQTISTEGDTTTVSPA